MKNKLNFSRIAMVLTSLVILGMIVAVPLAPAYGWPAPAPKSGVAPEQAVNTQVDPYPYIYIGSAKLNWAAPGGLTDTLTAPLPPVGEKLPDLGSIDLGFLANCSAGSLSGSVDLSTTLVFPEVIITAADKTTTTRHVSIISGTCSDPILYILSEKFTQTTEAGQSVERQFELDGTLDSATNTYTGEYRETLWGYGPQPITMVGAFNLILTSPSLQETQVYTLTVNSEHGTVTKDPDWATYHEGDVVQLTAAPETGWIFAGWSGGLTDTANPGMVIIHGNTSVTANYRQFSTIIWADPLNIIYGTALSDTQLNAIANTPGTFTYTPSAGTIPTIGTHTLHVDFVPYDSVNYTNASKDVSINVLESTAPFITSITRVNANPTDLTTLDFAVTFSEPVSGVDAVGPTFDDFSLTTTTGITGASVTSVSGSGATYTVTVNTGSGNGTLRLDVGTTGNIQDAASNPMAVGFTSGEVYSVIKTSTFDDVPDDYWARNFIERLYLSDITGGCSLTPLMYCPENTVTRAQMAVLLLRGIHGSSYVPPSVGDSTGFADVPTDHPVAAWIKQLAAEGITGGCEAGIYCPDDNVTRAQMAVFLLRAKYTSTYTPPPANGIFTDVPVDYSVAAWIEQLAAEGITGGCEADIYCPDDNVTRAQMAVFLVRTFNLP